MKILSIALILALGSSGALCAQSPERLRASSEMTTLDARGTAGAQLAQYGMEPSAPAPAAWPGMKALKLNHGANGDIEISNPPAEAPVVEGKLADDVVKEEYVEGYAYEPLAPGELLDALPSKARACAIDRDCGVPEDLLKKALDYFNSNTGKIKNRKYIGIVDFSRHSSRERFWLLDMRTGSAHAMHVAHGSGSDPDDDGFATRFSNVQDSNASSLGFYLTGALYKGKHGKSMRLHGLSPSNSNVLTRAVVVHEADYVREANVQPGRSQGCLAVAASEIAGVLSALKGGALIYAGLSGSEF